MVIANKLELNYMLLL